MTTSLHWRWFTGTILGIGLIASTVDVALAQDKLDRTTLPIQAPTYKAITEVDARRGGGHPEYKPAQVQQPLGVWDIEPFSGDFVAK